ncbi:MAG: small-conductance mechanosensitive channel [Paracoccaceae bacterium]|jgi:small-conductance mechanosensitive channel
MTHRAPAADIAPLSAVRHDGRRASRPRRLRAALRAVMTALALALMLLGQGADPAHAQAGIDYTNLFGRSRAETPPPAPDPAGAQPPGVTANPDGSINRAPEVAAYGALAASPDGNMILRTTENVSVFRQRLDRIARSIPDLWIDKEGALSRAAPDGKAGYFLGVILVSIIALMIGRAVVMIYAVFIAMPVMIAAQRRPAPPVTLGDKLPVLATRLGLSLAGFLIMEAVAVSLGLAIVGDHKQSLITMGILMGSYGLYMMVDTVWRMTICPYLTDYRIPRFSDTQARRLYLWASASAGVSIGGQAYCAWIEALGVSPEAHAISVTVTGFMSLAIAVGLIWANREAISGAILGGRPRATSSWLASIASVIWAPAATVYLIAAWGEGVVRLILGLEQNIPLLTGAFITLMVGLVVYAVSVFIVEKLFARARIRKMVILPPVPADIVAAEMADGGGMGGDADGDDEGGPATHRRAAKPASRKVDPRRPHAMSSFEDLAQRGASIFAAGVAFWLLARIWGGPEIFADGAPLDFLQDVVDKLFMGYVAYHAVRIWLDKRIEDEGGDDFEAAPGDEGAGSSASRLATLLPLFRSFILFFIILATVLSIAMQLGVNVSPLFAGAGVVGLAIGFGAQTLVRDILSGMFFLLDDAFRKGEYIDVGLVKGTVEKISIRSFQLRHHLGALHTIPFGEITHLTNFSRDWVMMKLPLRLTYDTDVEKVRKLVKKLGQKLLEHPTEGPKFVQQLKSQGVIMMEDSAMILRVKYMTRPGDQWTTRKLVYHEIRELFAREGIHFAHKEVTVRLPGLPEGHRLTDDEARIAGAAARRAVEMEDEGAGGLTSAAAMR